MSKRLEAGAGRCGIFVSALALTACAGLRDYQRHGRIYEMTPSAVASYESAVRAAAAESGTDEAGRAKAVCDRLLREASRFWTWEGPGVSPEVLLEVDRRGACALADRLAGEMAERQAERRRAAESAAREEAARQAAVAARQVEAREAELHANEASAREAAVAAAEQALVAVRARCAAVRVENTFEARVAAIDRSFGGGPDPLSDDLQVVARGLDSCVKGDEFDRRRCADARDLARAQAGRAEIVVRSSAPLRPIDFKTLRFPVDVPKLGAFFLESYAFEGEDAAGVTSQVVVEVEAAEHRVTLPMHDRAEAEVVKKAAAPLGVLIVRGRGFVRAGAEYRFEERRMWAQLEAQVGADNGRHRIIPVETWRLDFTTAGAQVISGTDGAVLLSQPPAIDFEGLDPAECADVEQVAERRDAFRVRVALMKAALEPRQPFVGNLNW